ncbi:hypothetical protein D9611_012797 [Ephemerocybe angulata]|uniref:Peptidase A1 domain-containing protein n=1 Tax=Ephemerocybe angulata TaxID=980116 RepID=A0A8H5FJ96_9AGAR|nr:hypothetical protein D9611_012797 [Tulosesus angulatus]
MLVQSFSAVAFLGLAQLADASGSPSTGHRRTASGGQTMNLVRSAPNSNQWTTQQWGHWAKTQKSSLEAKYGGASGAGVKKRATGTNAIINQIGDSTYFGSLAIGTPPVSYNVQLDTGSADLWVAGSNCTTDCSGMATFNPSSSSTFHNESSSFSVSYGSGQAAGFLSQDVVQMAGFEVQNQIFGVCEQVSSGLLTEPVSGLLGLAFQSIASSGAPPFWETLVTEGAWDEPVMAFHLTRYLNLSGVQTLEPGGSFSMGFANTSLYTGDIDYVNLAVTGSYWILPITSISVQNQSINAPSGDQAYAAIDTGTTLVGGPSSFIAEIFKQIPGSAPGKDDFKGYYTYPCDTNVTVALSFGGRTWSISPADFRLTRLTKDECLGAFFENTVGGRAPAWIVGDTFLKNVYSVFRYSPASVGFAELSAVALAQNGDANAAVPSATIGSSPSSVSATGSMLPGRHKGAGIKIGQGLLYATTVSLLIMIASVHCVLL